MPTNSKKNPFKTSYKKIIKELPNSDFKGYFSLFDPKLDFSYISIHVLSDYVKKSNI